MSECEFCGWCENPGRCVWSVTCPLCASGPREHCRVPGTTRVEGLHAKRWAAAGIDWRALKDDAAVVLDVPKTIDARVVDLITSPDPDRGVIATKAHAWERRRRVQEM